MKKNDELLNFKPISRKRMDLLWLDPPRLSQLGKSLAQNNIISITIKDDFGKERTNEITQEDFLWAKKIEKIVDKAFSAGQKGDFKKSVKYYEKALKLAPGCDLFLMSIGVAYVQLGEREKGIQYLEKAAEISPGNNRIRENLVHARQQ